MSQRGDTPLPPGAGPGMLEQFLSQVGLPLPNALFQELQRSNFNLERLMPDIHKLAEASDSLPQLAAALQRFNPEDMRKMTQALTEASKTGEKLYERLWPGAK